ncbi:hypothetical protein NDU88_002296 [Pleurodeles waltl]|uniref:Uncharacterized protein n=1 Tax=Pleurodeles waltl TaxID=8319 RepID=A0AAV7KRR5_PLEWA|nr:hypothetical protein NDU88_002296 [Pleurodeles waltl]
MSPGRGAGRARNKGDRAYGMEAPGGSGPQRSACNVDNQEQVGNPGRARVHNAAVRDTASIEFEGHRIGLYQDLSMITLQRRRSLRPVTELLRKEDIRYKWGHLFRLHFTWQNELRSIRTLEEAQGLDGMPLNLGDQAHKAASQAQLPGSVRGHKTGDIKPANLQPLRAKRRGRHCSEIYAAKIAYQKRIPITEMNWLAMWDLPWLPS